MTEYIAMLLVRRCAGTVPPGRACSSIVQNASLRCSPDTRPPSFPLSHCTCGRRRNRKIVNFSWVAISTSWPNLIRGLGRRRRASPRCVATGGVRSNQSLINHQSIINDQGFYAWQMGENWYTNERTWSLSFFYPDLQDLEQKK